MGGSGILGAFEELVLLTVVAQRGDGYGVTLRRALDERTGSDVSMGAVHATLERLEEKGLVRSQVGGRGRAARGRPRRYFEATEAGLRELAHTREVRDRVWDAVRPADLQAAGDAGEG